MQGRFTAWRTGLGRHIRVSYLFTLTTTDCSRVPLYNGSEAVAFVLGGRGSMKRLGQLIIGVVVAVAIVNTAFATVSPVPA
jgi:hypothetical protein